MSEPSAEQRIARLEAENERLRARLEKAKHYYKLAMRQRRDELLAAVAGGLAVRWDFEHTSAERLALKAEQLVGRLLEFRRQRDAGTSPLDPKQRAIAYRKANPMPAPSTAGKQQEAGPAPVPEAGAGTPAGGNHVEKT